MTTISLNSELARMRIEKGPKDVIQYAGEARGANRIAGFFQKALQTLGLTRYAAPAMARVRADLGATGSILGIIDIPHSVAEASESVKALGDPTICLSRRIANAAADSFGALAAIGYGAAYFCGFGWLIAPVQAINTASDAVECQINASNLHEVAQLAQLEGKVDGEAKEAVLHSKKFYALKTAIKATSVALSIIGLAIWASGISFVTGFTLSIVSLSLSTLAIKVDLLKDPRKLLKCDRTIVV